ncbi:galectin-8 isoform X2 [Latimeria chalumnae]|uniref:Galectin n=2 Tax=Latimeria chalumnae TaxID=7897 RepID=H3BC09_LATCH|nr:PREDICTED: galectin-8 isoform X2 [Latimeria chalumnae]|eukprot:XP_005989776.1 PREDICTED: galectin-8 isoform X2 [Latimeria chalumnae]
MAAAKSLREIVYNPVIPYTGTLLGGLHNEDIIIIHGSVPSDADRFQVDFQCGNSVKPRADVAFHFNPRFRRSGCIVCNTLQGEKWGHEEITYEMPFKKGESFEIHFLVLKHMFRVAVNKKHLLEYSHRIDLNRVDTLGVYGKVQVQAMGIIPAPSPSPSTPVMMKANETIVQSSSPPAPVMVKEKTANDVETRNTEFVVPYLGSLNDGLRPGKTIVLKGEVSKNANYFTINLKSTESNDIALHLNPRIKTQELVRNSLLHESWGEEEKSVPNFPFTPGVYFEIIIHCDASQYKVAVNGVHMLDYKHRFKDLGKINLVEIDGDIQILDVIL